MEPSAVVTAAVAAAVGDTSDLGVVAAPYVGENNLACVVGKAPWLLPLLPMLPWHRV